METFARSRGTPALPGHPLPVRSQVAARLDELWPTLKVSDPPLDSILHGEIADRFRALSAVDGHARVTMITNPQGELIASDGKSDDYFQADEEWWRAAFNEGKGKLYISSITASTGEGPLKAGDQTVVIAFPVYATVDGKRAIIGIVKDELSVSWLLRTLQKNAQGLDALTQLIDLGKGTTVYANGGDDAGPAGPAAKRTENFYRNQGRSHASVMTLLYNNLVYGATEVDVAERLSASTMTKFDDVQAPRWAVVVSKPSEEAMTPVYRLAGIVAGVGVALILVLFILGVAISNREIIMPVMRLREATAAVGRGELNVRLMSNNARGAPDKTFRRDELGDLARDFDEMTRQLQKNVNQLAKSNEAKRRFMELAGHELRTPVTYLLGVCQLAQKQLEQISAAAEILTKLLTVDGAGSGLDADLLDGQSSAAFQPVDSDLAERLLGAFPRE